jgi:hypothetical protein
MRTLLIISLSLAFCVASCEKDKNESAPNEPSSVSFVYDGDTVEYGIIKRTYAMGPDSEQLFTPEIKYWLDRNLGAEQAAAYPNDALARGDLFQWGRVADGHQKRTSMTTDSLATSPVPGHDRFITDPAGGNWLTVTNNQLWNPPANANCACPAGWHVATEDELKMERLSWTHDNIRDSFNSTLKWVPTGNRDNHGIERYADSWAFMWSSTVKNGSVPSLAIIGGGASEVLSSPRIYGLAVRCVKD